jgi:hypothetical protein
MPADRLLHPRAGHSRKVSSLTDLEFRVWIQYLLSADDFGILPATAVALQSANDYLLSIPAKKLVKAIAVLVSIELVRVFTHQERQYLYQPDWQDWQKVRWPAKTIHPEPPSEYLSSETKELLKNFPGGKKVPPKNSRSTSEELPPTRETANGLRLTAHANGSEGGSGETAPLDVAFEAFKAAYPSERRNFGRIVEGLFLVAIESGKTTLAMMLAALENHKASAQWQDPSKIPNPEKWLAQERWNSTMPSAADAARAATNAKLPTWARS